MKEESRVVIDLPPGNGWVGDRHIIHNRFPLTATLLDVEKWVVAEREFHKNQATDHLFNCFNHPNSVVDLEVRDPRGGPWCLHNRLKGSFGTVDGMPVPSEVFDEAMKRAILGSSITEPAPGVSHMNAEELPPGHPPAELTPEQRDAKPCYPDLGPVKYAEEISPRYTRETPPLEMQMKTASIDIPFFKQPEKSSAESARRDATAPCPDFSEVGTLPPLTVEGDIAKNFPGLANTCIPDFAWADRPENQVSVGKIADELLAQQAKRSLSDVVKSAQRVYRYDPKATNYDDLLSKPAVGVIFNEMRRDPLVKMHLDYWQNGQFKTFEEMLASLAVALWCERQRSTDEAVARLERDRSSDVLVFNYPDGDSLAQAKAVENAARIKDRIAVACSRDPKGNWPAVQQVGMKFDPVPPPATEEKK